MEIKSNLCSNAVRKVALLITKASDLGLDLSGYGFADENTNSGHVYLWLEDEIFTLYIDLGSDEIKALWTNGNNGDEEIMSVDGIEYDEIYEWANNLSAKQMGESA